MVGEGKGRFDVKVEMGPEFRAYAIAEAESLIRAGRLKAMPDGDKELRRDLFEQAMKG